MQDAEENATSPTVDAAPQWTPWGQPRLTREGVETAFHHRLVLIREAGGAARPVNPGEAFVSQGADVEWSPMMWALEGRRPGRGANSLETSRTFTGAQDRLFTTIDSVCEQLFEGASLSPVTLARWVEALETRRAFCETRGIVYRHLVVPDGHAICADAIPGAPRLSEDRPLRRILATAGENLRAVFVYPLDALIDARGQEETSLPHDVHMTRYGAYLIYRALAASLPMIDPDSVLTPEALRSRMVLLAGDVARAAGLPARRIKMHEPPSIPHKSLIKGTSYRTHQVDVLEGENKELPRLVMFRTSNASQLFPYLLRHFSRIATVASAEAFFDLIESERPDAVVAEMPERYFAPRRLDENDPDTGWPPEDKADAFETLTGHALPLPGARTD